MAKSLYFAMDDFTAHTMSFANCFNCRLSINFQKFSSFRKVSMSGVAKVALSAGFSATQPRRVPARVAEVL